MWRWSSLIAAAALLATASPARASVHLGAAVLTRCDTGVATFEGRVTPLKRAAKAQMRFTLQSRTPDAPRWSAVSLAGWGTWITAPPKVGRYLYDKTVEQLAAPGEYRAVVQFRWRDARGQTVRSERAVSKPCSQPDPRPDLKVTSLRAGTRYVAVVANQGRGDAGPFSVAFLRNGQPLGSVPVAGLAAGAHIPVALDAPPCSPGDLIAAQADSADVIDEADEDGNVLSVPC